MSLYLHLYWGQPLDWFPPLVAQIQSPQFTTLVLTIHDYFLLELRQFRHSIRRIDLALDEQSLATLRHVVVLFPESVTPEQLDMVKACLPLCTERGLVRYSRGQ
jgi:hypothetical protein